MRHILIIEDEPISAERLKRMLLDLDDTFVIDGRYQACNKYWGSLRFEMTMTLSFLTFAWVTKPFSTLSMR